MIPPVLIVIGAVVSWLSAIGLVYAASIASPKVGALTERAILGLIISAFLTVYAFVAYNTESGFEFFPFESTVALLRIAVLGLSMVAPVWLLLWWTGRLGDGG